MKIGGLIKSSMIDYPGKISCVIFTCGCNYTCPFCHNPDLVRQVPDKVDTGFDVGKIKKFLEKRKHLLDGIVITGGEPTLQRNLAGFCGMVKNLGFSVKLDTNGSSPGIVRMLIEKGLIDYIAMDIKAVPSDYAGFAAGFSETVFQESLSMLLEGRVDYEFRTTCAKPFVTIEMIREISGRIRGARLYALQRFRPDNILNPGFYRDMALYTEADMEEFRAIAEKNVTSCIIR